jgi:hypothetical protein
MEIWTPIPTDGITRCDCGSKYWDTRTEWLHTHDSNEAQVTKKYKCHSCGETYRLKVGGAK